MPKHFLTPETHLADLDRRVAELSATVRKIYATWYAANIRRNLKYGKQMQSMLKSMATVKEHLPTLRRLVRLSQSLEAGRIVITLPKAQHQKLMWMLRDKPEEKEPGQI